MFKQKITSDDIIRQQYKVEDLQKMCFEQGHRDKYFGMFKGWKCERCGADRNAPIF